jgi:FAD/FMN-containing dehydrogenase
MNKGRKSLHSDVFWLGGFIADLRRSMKDLQHLPTLPQDVAIAVRLPSPANLIDHDPCPIAIESGCHTAFAGSANIAFGITIDWAAINEITVNPDHTLTTIGAGQRWGAMYERLVQVSLVVVGGMAAPVGIGGITTGGTEYYT